MTETPVQEDPALRLRYYRETGQLDEAKNYEAYLQQTGQLPASAKPPTSGPGWAAHVLNISKGIQGMERLEAAAGAIGNNIPYEQSLKALRDVTGQVTGNAATAEHIGGSLVPLAFPFLRGLSAVKAGAALTGADQALSADQMSPAERAVRTAGGATLGAVLGRVADVGVTGVRSLLTKNTASQLLEKQAARAASANRLYGAALAEGQGQQATPAIKAFLAEPDIAEIVTELQSTRPFQGASAESPEMLDAVYKTLSDRAATVKKGLESVTPNKPNIGRFRGQDIKAAQEDALNAISGSSMPGPMPTYREAVADFAKRSREMEAIQRGNDAVRAGMSKAIPSGKAALKKSPETFADWMATKGTPADATAATQGILGAVKTGMQRAPLTTGRRALMAAPGLLHETDGSLPALLAKFGLLSVTGSMK